MVIGELGLGHGDHRSAVLSNRVVFAGTTCEREPVESAILECHSVRG